MFKLFLFTLLLINICAQSTSNVGVQGVNITELILDSDDPYQVYFRTSGDDLSKFEDYHESGDWYCDPYCKYNRYHALVSPPTVWKDQVFQFLTKAIENKWLVNITYCFYTKDPTKILYGVVCGVAR
jgi:hypothetical protein